jgi:hypothetical protein
MLVILFKNVGKHIEADVLFKTVEEVKLTEKQFDSLKRELDAVKDLERIV